MYIIIPKALQGFRNILKKNKEAVFIFYFFKLKYS